MAAALISRGPQRLATLESLMETSENSYSSSSSKQQRGEKVWCKKSHRWIAPVGIAELAGSPNSSRGELVNRPSRRIMDEVAHKYGAALALKEVDSERNHISDTGLGMPFSVLVVGQNEAHTSLSSALRVAAAAPGTTRTLIYLQGDVFEETETLELAGIVCIQPDPGNTTSRPVIRMASSRGGVRCASTSARITFISVRLELCAPVQRKTNAVQVCTKPLVHPASNGHVSEHTGFTSSAHTPPACVDVRMGQITLQTCLVVNLTGDGVAVSEQGLAVLEESEVKCSGRHGIRVSAGGVASVKSCRIISCAGCGCVVSGIDASAVIEESTLELNSQAGLAVESGGSLMADGVRALRNAAEGVLARGSGSNLLLLRSTLQANRGDGLRVVALTPSEARRESVTSCTALGSGRSDVLMQMRGYTPIPHARQVSGGSRGGLGGVFAQVADCEIARNGSAGVSVEQSGAQCRVRASRMEHNGSQGVRAANGGEARVFDSKIHANGGAGVQADGGGARCLVASSSLTSNEVGASAPHAGEVRLYKCKMAQNKAAQIHHANAGRVDEEKVCDGQGQWVEFSDGVPVEEFHRDLPWLNKLREKLKTNTLRTWHGF